jgi:hypothetical protein
VHVLADNGRYVLAEAGPRLYFFERRILPSWTVYVSGLLACIGLANVVIQVIVGNLAAAGAIAVVTALSAAALRAALLRRRRARATALAATDAHLQVDLEGRVLLDGGGQVLAPLDQARVEKPMQLTSSARALAVVWPGGRRVVYRGDPLSLNGSIDAPAGALKARGVPSAW